VGLRLDYQSRGGKPRASIGSALAATLMGIRLPWWIILPLVVLTGWLALFVLTRQN
jgi:hypothetical protein